MTTPAVCCLVAASEDIGFTGWATWFQTNVFMQRFHPFWLRPGCRVNIVETPDVLLSCTLWRQQVGPFGVMVVYILVPGKSRGTRRPWTDGGMQPRHPKSM